MSNNIQRKLPAFWIDARSGNVLLLLVLLLFLAGCPSIHRFEDEYGKCLSTKETREKDGGLISREIEIIRRPDTCSTLLEVKVTGIQNYEERTAYQYEKQWSWRCRSWSMGGETLEIILWPVTLGIIPIGNIIYDFYFIPRTYGWGAMYLLPLEIIAHVNPLQNVRWWYGMEQQYTRILEKAYIGKEWELRETTTDEISYSTDISDSYQKDCDPHQNVTIRVKGTAIEKKTDKNGMVRFDLEPFIARTKRRWFSCRNCDWERERSG